MVRDLYLNHNIEVLPQAEGIENDVVNDATPYLWLMITLKIHYKGC